MERPTRLFDFVRYQLAHHPLERAYGGRKDGNWAYLSTAEVIRQAEELSAGLLKLGVKPGDKIALAVYQNRPEWVVTDLAIQQIGAINVPVYPTISPSDYEYIFNDAAVKFCFVGSGDLYDKVNKAKANVASLEQIFTFEEQPGTTHWETLFTKDGVAEIAGMSEQVSPKDLATIIYTSGTTGEPKGVMLSHHNIVSNVMDVMELMPVHAGHKVLSFLPLCHIFERAALYAYTYLGVEIHFTGTDNLGGEDGDLRAVAPHFFTTVPRLLEKVYEKIYNKGLELTGVKKSLFFWALSLTNDFEYDKPYSGLAGLKRSIADKLIFSKWREALGGNVRGILTGAAPCPLKMAKVFSAAGIPIREGYGLTETSPGLAVGRYTPGGAMLGAVGPALRSVRLKIDSSDGVYGEGEGEVLAHGPNVMMGYYNKPEATAEVFKDIDGERWFRTGDVGRLLKGPGGEYFLQITDRKKELLKTSGGKYVAPAPIENKLKEDFLIEQVMVVGEQRKFVSAIILPAEEALHDWCNRHEVPWNGLADAINHPKVIAKYQSIIDKYNPNFSKIEQVKKFCLLPVTWEPVRADGTDAELTPTMKLKRRVIRDKYQEQIASIYSAS